MANRLQIIFLVFALLSLPSLCRGGGAEGVDATGYAQLVDGRKDLAREAALQNAFRNAVEQAVGVLIRSESVVDNFRMIKDTLSSQSAGFIRRYGILEEKESADGYSIRIRAQVSRVRLEKRLDDMGLLLKRMGKPRMVMLLSEQGVQQDRPSYWWGAGEPARGIAESAMAGRLLRSGFNFVDRQSILAQLKREGLEGKLGATLSNEEALKILSSGEAEIAIIGEASAKAATAGIGGTNFRACQATVSARAINTDTGELLASFTSNAVVPHVNPATGAALALEKASLEGAEKLQKQILAKWKGRAQSAWIVKMVALGLDYREVREFVSQLKDQVDAVEEVIERSYSKETAKLELETGESARELADHLSGMEFKGRRIKIVSLTANMLELEIDRK